MQRFQLRFTTVLAALMGAVLIFFTTAFVARQLLQSAAYSKSRLISMIVTQDSVEVGELVGNRRNVDMLFKFVGALTSAYIDFELIPVGEIGTFAAVFESASDQVEIERFAYQRKNLTIYGYAQTEADYEAFLTNLQETGYFETVTGHWYIATDDTAPFEIECVSQSVSVNLELG